MKIRKPTEHEFQELRHVIFTSDVSWNPSEFNHQYDAPDISLFETSHDDLFEDEDLVYLDSRQLLDADARNLQRYIAVADFRPIVEQLRVASYARSNAYGESERALLFRAAQGVISARAQFYKDFERDHPVEFDIIRAETQAARDTIDIHNSPTFHDSRYELLHASNIRKEETQMRAFLSAGMLRPRDEPYELRPDFRINPPRPVWDSFDDYDMDTRVNFNTYMLELNPQSIQPQDWYTYLDNTTVLPEPYLEMPTAAPRSDDEVSNADTHYDSPDDVSAHSVRLVNASDIRRVEPDYEIIRPFFGYAPADVENKPSVQQRSSHATWSDYRSVSTSSRAFRL